MVVAGDLMADDPNIIPRSAILQSITTEAGGFYTTVTTVASTFLGGSLIFLEKFAAVQNAATLTILAIAWAALIGSIGFVARVRYLNLKSGRLALRDDDTGADAIDLKTARYSHYSQWLLIIGMVALFIVGLMNVSFAGQKEETILSNENAPKRLEKSIPYGSLKPATQTPVSQSPSRVPVAPQQHPPTEWRQVAMEELRLVEEREPGDNWFAGSIAYGSIKAKLPTPKPP